MATNRLKRNIFKLWILFSQNGLSQTLSFLISRMQGEKSARLLWFKGRQLWIRPGTPDLNVAYECFGDEYKKLKEIVNHDSCGYIIDAGGYIGTAALALSEIFRKCKIITIEPDKLNFEMLSKNVAQNHMITPINAALIPSDWRGRVKLINENAGEWGYQAAPMGKDEVDEIDPINAITMDEILRMTGSGRVLIMKMDIEGAEMDLLKCSSDWLSRTDVLFVELHPSIHNEVEEVYADACRGRHEVKVFGEKKLSVVRSLLQ